MKYNVFIKRSRINKVWKGFADRFSDASTAKVAIEHTDIWNMSRVSKGDPEGILKQKSSLFTLSEVETEVIPNLDETRLFGDAPVCLKDLRIVPNPEA